MELDASFAAFLETKVNLKQYKLDLLDSRVTAITNALQADADISGRYRAYVKQGSWAHRTIIEPVGAFDEFDADFLLHLREEPDWDTDPREYLRAVRAAFARHSTYTSMASRKNRCVRITYANSCHVDVVPYITLADGREVVVNYADNKFEETNPTGLSAWMKEKDDLANGNLRLVIRLLKYLRDYKNTFDCPSVILTTLVGQRVSPIDAASRYSSVAKTLVHLLEDLVAYLDVWWSMPGIEDPSCPGTTFNHRWDEDKYRNFKAQMARYAGWAREALDATDVDASVTAWCKLFGDDLTAAEVTDPARSLALSRIGKPARVSKQLTMRAPAEQFIEELYPVDIRYMARIDAYAIRPSGARHPRTFDAGWKLKPGRRLRFELRTDVPGTYQIIWKVRNRGEMATRLGKLRGRLIYGAGRRHTESTRFPGQHYVEAFVLQNGVVVGADRVEVTIV